MGWSSWDCLLAAPILLGLGQPAYLAYLVWVMGTNFGLLSIYLFVAIRRFHHFRWRSFLLHVSTLSGWVFPIQPVMDSRCLSAAGLRFLEHPLPTEEFCFPCGWLTEEIFRPHWGYHVPHRGATTGVGVL